METMVPKLVAEDIPLLNSLLSDVFPGVAYVPAEMTRLREEIAKVCREMYLTYSEVGSDEIGGQWVEKVCWELVSFTVDAVCAHFISTGNLLLKFSCQTLQFTVLLKYLLKALTCKTDPKPYPKL